MYADLVAELGESNVLKPRDVLNNVLQVIDVREVQFHRLVELVNRLGELFSQHKPKKVGEVAGAVEHNPLGAFVEDQR